MADQGLDISLDQEHEWHQGGFLPVRPPWQGNDARPSRPVLFGLVFPGPRAEWLSTKAAEGRHAAFLLAKADGGCD